MLPTEAKRVEELLADLDVNDFDKRQNATKELEKLGEQIEPALRRALEGQPSQEARRRLEVLLKNMSDQSYNLSRMPAACYAPSKCWNEQVPKRRGRCWRR